MRPAVFPLVPDFIRRAAAPAFVSLLLAGALAAQTPYDLLLKNGHVIDPKNNIDRVEDVAISNGKIARVAPNIAASQAKQTVDATGLYVTPGLIDIHTHVYVWQDMAGEGVQPDAFSFRSGVTTMVDAGSSGADSFADFRDRIIKHSKTRVLAFLNIVHAGMGTGHENDPAQMDFEAAARVAKANPDIIVGFKSAHYAGPGWASVDGAVKAGNLTGLPVMVDFGQITATRNINALFLDHLRPGDIYTHCFSGHRDELLATGKLNPAMEAGRKRGIIFDIGFGAGSFYWYVAVPAYAEHFYPDSISSDLHTSSMNGGMKTIPNVMSELMSLGSSVQDVVRMTTSAPAKEIHHPQLGNLDPGADADIAVLRVEHGNFGYLDSALARKSGTEKVTCELTLRAGKVMWDLNGLASQDWTTFPYQKHWLQPQK
ncbi:MAG TPA: amidohydrolase/deacetylase family metallohydrolase [Bryobacteraceae bacterium]|nr:amidohydrolase/deacetylase family metallohydrolase [Bryobacteraceae bacterium]